MSQTNKKRGGHGWLAWYIPFVFAEFIWFIALLIHGKNIAVLNPTGWVSEQQHALLIFTITLLCVVAVPTVLFLYYTAWKYRESNTNVTHDPDAKHGKGLVFAIWAIPTFFMVVLMTVMFPATHKLEPRKAVVADKKPITIQVVAMRWKWVFLYPDQKIATVNFVQIPEDTPVEFQLTADDAPMSSFWIPNLAGQLYAMTGHVNRLNLVADKPGDYPGSSAEINGAGFAGMRFTTRVSSDAEFEHWAADIRQAHHVLDSTAYADLVKPSEDNPQTFYSEYKSDLYASVLNKYSDSHAGHEHEYAEHTNHEVHE